MEIKKCDESYVNAVYNLICELENTKFNYDNYKTAFYEKLKNNNNYYIVGIEENEIIGFLSLNVDYQLHHASKVATIEELIVKNRNRGNGAGKQLLDNAINYAKKNECDVIEVTSNLSRERAHNFYIKNGFNKSSYKFITKLNNETK
jgi:PhnO protein